MSKRRHPRLAMLRTSSEPIGAVVLGLGGAMVLCVLTAWIWDRVVPTKEFVATPRGDYALVFSAVVSLGLGGFMFWWGRSDPFRRKSLSRRDAIVAVVGIWFAAAALGGLPFLVGSEMGAADSLFESMSGLTTTGATVVTNIKGTFNRSLLLWRSVIQWLGGMGIVVLFVAVFPSMGAGGKHLFRGEVPGAQAEGLKPRIAETGVVLWRLYAFFTALECVILIALGMDPFKALCHSLTTMSTGGFSTEDGSVGAFGRADFEYVISIFMLIGTVNYGLYFAALRHRTLRAITRSTEFRVYTGIVLFAVAALTLLNIDVHASDWELSFRRALFSTATVISSTGYGTDNYTHWGSLAFGIMIVLMFIGGCSGSTAGGIKIERVILMLKQSVAQIRSSFEPSVVSVVRMGSQSVGKPVLADVMSFFIVYIAVLAGGSFLVCGAEIVADTAFNISVERAFGAMLTSLSNMGPAPFHDVAYSDNFAPYSEGSKLIFVVAMLLGRLEFFTLLALLLPSFWRR